MLIGVSAREGLGRLVLCALLLAVMVPSAFATPSDDAYIRGYVSAILGRDLEIMGARVEATAGLVTVSSDGSLAHDRDRIVTALSKVRGMVRVGVVARAEKRGLPEPAPPASAGPTAPAARRPRAPARRRRDYCPPVGCRRACSSIRSTPIRAGRTSPPAISDTSAIETSVTWPPRASAKRSPCTGAMPGPGANGRSVSRRASSRSSTLMRHPLISSTQTIPSRRRSATAMAHSPRSPASSTKARTAATSSCSAPRRNGST
jgi:hypothetical protein